jgi:hypothetical protein
MIFSRHTTQNSHGVAQKTANCGERTEGLSETYNLKYVPAPSMNVSFTRRPPTKLIVVGSKKLFRVIPADRDEQYEEVAGGRTVLRSEGITLANHFKRWYFHAKESQRIVEATELAGKLA